jgi:hypothetical protein
MPLFEQYHLSKLAMLLLQTLQNSRLKLSPTYMRAGASIAKNVMTRWAVLKPRYFWVLLQGKCHSSGWGMESQQGGMCLISPCSAHWNPNHRGMTVGYVKFLGNKGSMQGWEKLSDLKPLVEVAILGVFSGCFCSLARGRVEILFSFQDNIMYKRFSG